MSKIIQMKDSEGINLYPKVLEEYSTTEQIIGRWIDGKPIYRKTVTFTNDTFVNNTALTTGISNLENVVRMECVVKNRQDNGWRNIPWLYNSGTSYPSAWTGGFFLTSDHKIFFQLGSTLGSIYKIFATIEYTKTTD